MAVLPLIKYPDPVLLKPAEPIKDVRKPAVQKLISSMLETMVKNSGVGLAAPQVGKSLRLCVITVEEETFILINPRITYKSWLKEVCDEGCLSFPGKFLPIQRHKKVRVKALNEFGEEINIKAEGLLSRALQHEIDHLDGILFIEKEIKKAIRKNPKSK